MNQLLPLDGTLAGMEAARILPAAAGAGEAFARLYALVARLRASDGCPWDREQTVQSIRGNILEEAYELVEAIDEDSSDHIREESGDLFMLATMVSYMSEQEDSFSVASALDGVCEKLVRRHPHVFAQSDVDTAEGVVAQWNEIKETVEGRRRKDSVLDEVSRALPPLERAYKLQKKAAKAGFDWSHRNQVWEKFEEEIAEVRNAAEAASAEASTEAASLEDLENEIGDLLFTVVNLSRHMGVDPGLAMHGAVEKFSRRFRHVEKGMAGKGLPMTSERMTEMDALWDEAKGLGL
ncbi:MAG: nucleoside triphosphate pyrophosphohydrolase [Rectinema sp.]